MRKPRGDSVLKTLPPERQADIIERLTRAGGTYRETRAWLNADGIETSLAALHEFYSWYQINNVLRAVERDSQDFMAMLREYEPDMPEDKITKLGSQYFQSRALKAGDAETFLAVTDARHKADIANRKLDQKERAMDLERRRVELLEKKAAQADEVRAALESEASPEDIMQRTRAIFGM